MPDGNLQFLHRSLIRLDLVSRAATGALHVARCLRKLLLDNRSAGDNLFLIGQRIINASKPHFSSLGFDRRFGEKHTHRPQRLRLAHKARKQLLLRNLIRQVLEAGEVLGQHRELLGQFRRLRRLQRLSEQLLKRERAAHDFLRGSAQSVAGFFGPCAHAARHVAKDDFERAAHFLRINRSLKRLPPELGKADSSKRRAHRARYVSSRAAKAIQIALAVTQAARVHTEDKARQVHQVRSIGDLRSGLRFTISTQ